MKKDLDVIHFSLYHHMKKKYGYRPITKKEFFALLGRHFLVPKSLRICVYKEMEQLKLIEKIDKQTLRIADTIISIEESVGEYYRKMGFY